MSRALILASLLAASFGVAASASAEERSDCTDKPQAEWMSEDAIRAEATKLGYDVRDVRLEGSCYEVYAMNDGARVEVTVDPATGAVVDTGMGEDE